MTETTAVAGDQWTPKTLMEACMHIRSLEDEIRRLRSEIAAHRSQDMRDMLTGRKPI